MSIEARQGLQARLLTDAKILKERWQTRPGGLQRLIYEGWKTQKTSDTQKATDTQKLAMEKFKAVIPGEYSSIPELIDTYPDEVIGVLDSPRSDLLFSGYAYIAAVTMPEDGYHGEAMPKAVNHETETQQQQIFRLAMRQLIRKAEFFKRQNPTLMQRKVELLGARLRRLDEIRERDQTAEKDQAMIPRRLRRPLTKGEKGVQRREKDEVNAIQDYFDGEFANYFLAGMQEGYFTTVSARAELEKIARREILLQDWLQVFRVQPRGRREELGVERRQGEPPQQIPFEDNPRVTHLIELADLWGRNNIDPDLEPQVRELRFMQKSVGGKVTLTDRYFVAVLPQRLPDGRIIEHAVFDSDRDDNAIFVYRGERELETELNWVEVFDKSYKGDVVPFGARKIIHQGDWQSRVMGELTLPTDKLKPVEI